MISPKHSTKTPNIIPGKDDVLDEAKEREFEATIRLKAEVIRLPLQHRREHFLQLNFTQIVPVSTHTRQL